MGQEVILNKSSFRSKTFSRKSLSVILGTVLLFTAFVTVIAPSQTSETERRELFRQLARKWIMSGVEQYSKGNYEEAEKSLLRAEEYREHLMVSERNQLSEVLEKTRTAGGERKRILEAYRLVAELIKSDKLEQAKTELEKVKDSMSLRQEDRENIAEAIKRLDNQINAKAQSQVVGSSQLLTEKEPVATIGPEKIISTSEDRKREIADLYYRGVGLYRTGQLEKAREGFVEVVNSGLIPAPMEKTISDYVKKIDKTLADRARPKVIVPRPYRPRIVRPRVTEPLRAPRPSIIRPQAVEPVTSEGGYIEVINRKRNVIRSHTRAVVNDAIAKAQSYVSQGKFDKAQEVVASAELVVNNNQMYLGNEIFKQYINTLQQLNEQVTKAEQKGTAKQEAVRRQNAIEAQRRFRGQMEIDRLKRIKMLMENALVYQEQQRYEAALGQLEQLLAIDPQNDEALTLKDTLEDTIYYQRQLEVQKEADKHRADVLLRTDESAIPYADEMRYPKDWREIIQKPTRQPDKPLGLEPADAAVYEQLSHIVDLSQLTPTMPLSEAIELIRSSVEPPLTIFVNWSDLSQNANVDQSTPINMDPMSGVRLDTVLKRVLVAVSGAFAELGYIIDGGVITIATVDSLPSKLVPRIYDVTDLLGQPANFTQMPPYGYGDYAGGGTGGGGYGGGGMGGGGMGGGGYGGGGMGGGYGGGGMGGGMSGGYGGGGMGGGMSGGYGGGGMSGGYGGGGYGGGGMGGGYGGGGMGGGGMMGGMGGGIDYMRGVRARDLALLIQQTLGKPEDWAPDDWSGFTYGTGEGTITPYPQDQPKKLAVLQTIEIHGEIEKVLAEMRKALGHQVSIEARFLVVSENFLEDIGLDVDFEIGGGGSLNKWGIITFEQQSATITSPEATKVPGSMGQIQPGINIEGGYGSSLDPLMVHFLLRAVQAHTDAKTLTAPKVTVLSGESASFWVTNDVSYALPPDVQYGGSSGAYAGGGYQTSSVQQNVGFVQTGTLLNITPTIAQDKRNVLLNIITELRDLLRMKTHTIQGPVGATGEVVEYDITVPETETSQVMTRVSVPDGGTLLLGGQKVTAEIEKEAGVPVLSKIPVLGRLFSNRSKIRDQKILLVLVKPTVILQEEREAEAIAAMERGI